MLGNGLGGRPGWTADVGLRYEAYRYILLLWVLTSANFWGDSSQPSNTQHGAYAAHDWNETAWLGSRDVCERERWNHREVAPTSPVRGVVRPFESSADEKHLEGCSSACRLWRLGSLLVAGLLGTFHYGRSDSDLSLNLIIMKERTLWLVWCWFAREHVGAKSHVIFVRGDRC